MNIKLISISDFFKGVVKLSLLQFKSTFSLGLLIFIIFILPTLMMIGIGSLIAEVSCFGGVLSFAYGQYDKTIDELLSNEKILSNNNSFYIDYNHSTYNPYDWTQYSPFFIPQWFNN